MKDNVLNFNSSGLLTGNYDTDTTGYVQSGVSNTSSVNSGNTTTISNDVTGNYGQIGFAGTTNSITLGSYPYGYCHTYPSYTSYQFQVRTVVNGWVVWFNNAEHVFTDMAEMTKFLTESLKK